MSRTERAAVASHASAVVAAAAAAAAAGGPQAWTGMLAFAGPLLVLLAAGRRDAFVRAHAAAALRFNLSVAAYLGVITLGMQVLPGTAYTVQVVPFVLFVNLIVAFNWLVFTGIAVHRAATGQLFTYPMTLPGLRLPPTSSPERPS
jgi:uncharacterized Tic20 family protein